MSEEDKFLEAVKKLREEKGKRNFDQTLDLIVNLKNFDIRREAFSLFIEVPNKIKEKKIAGFFEKESKSVETIIKDNFSRYKEKKDIKKLIKKYDFFIANAKLMPLVATSFGRVLGPAGKMPSPQLGILANEDEKTINAVKEKINSTVRIKIKEPSIKTGIARQSNSDEEIVKNIMAVYNKLIEALPKKKENIRNVKIKFTMGEPILVEI